MKTFRALAIGGLLIAGSCLSVAQEQILPQVDGSMLPPPLPTELTDYPPNEAPLVTAPQAAENGSHAQSSASPIDAGAPGTLKGLDSIGSPLEGSGYFERTFDDCPALFESTGTWFRRGFWYTELDALLLNRQWDKHGLVLVSENVVGNIAPNIGQGILVGNEMRVDPGKPGVEGLPRLTLGMFLFRDGHNRDHNAEFTWFGGGEFKQHGELNSVTNAGLQVNDFIDRSASNGSASNPSFDGAQFSSFDYNHVVDSFEFNYSVKRRMHRDRMALQPSGEWVRQATPTRTVGYLAGLRFINLREQLNWLADGIPDPGANNANSATGDYFVDVDNDLLGTQIGGTVGYETDRWSVTGSGKIGAYWNQMDMNSGFAVSGANGSDLGSGATQVDADKLSTVGQFAVTGRWHIRPNMSVRAGFELLWIEAIALSPFQLNFIPGRYPAISQSGDSVYMGTSIGWETYW